MEKELREAELKMAKERKEIEEGRAELERNLSLGSH